MRDMRHVVFHQPGPKWDSALPFFEQEGVQEHVGHYRALHAEGKLEMGGPFLDATSGGMMITAQGVDDAEIAAFAEADPAVRSGLLIAVVRPWMLGMRR
jgi:uncharacterized protein YciI